MINSIHLVLFLSYRSLLFKFWTLCIFEPPLQGLGTTYDVHLWIIGKRMVDFLLMWLGVKAEALRANIGSKSAISFQQGPVNPKFQVEGVTLFQPFFLSQNWGKWSFMWYKNADTTFYHFVTRLTNRQTEFSSLDHVCTPCTAVINASSSRTNSCTQWYYGRSAVAVQLIQWLYDYMILSYTILHIKKLLYKAKISVIN